MSNEKPKKPQLKHVGILFIILGAFLPRLLADKVYSPISIDLLRLLFFIGIILFLIGARRSRKEKRNGQI